MRYYPIQEDMARKAKEMNSFSGYQDGSATAEYRKRVDDAVELAEKQKARVDPIYHGKIDAFVDAYARKLAENMNQRYSIESRVPAMMVAGPANFPIGKKEKQNKALDRNMEEWNQVQGLLEKIKSTGMGGIRTDNPRAVELLERKLAGLEEAQKMMRDTNVYYRKTGTLDGCPSLSPEQAEKVLASMEMPWRADEKPFPSYMLANNSAEIRRIKKRIGELKQNTEVGFCGWEFAGGKAVASQEYNRLQLFFDGKPTAEQRWELKQNGFRWAPKAGAWQRLLNHQAVLAAGRIGFIRPLSGKTPQELQPEGMAARQRAGQDGPSR